MHELPFGKNRRFLKSGVASYLLGDWQLNGMLHNGYWRVLYGHGRSYRLQLPRQFPICGRGLARHLVQLFSTLLSEITLIDLDLSDSRSIWAIRTMIETHPEACIIGLLTDDWDELGRAALMAGAWSCVSKDRLANDLTAAMQRASGRHP